MQKYIMEGQDTLAKTKMSTNILSKNGKKFRKN
jgi:hypothetical protein